MIILTTCNGPLIGRFLEIDFVVNQSSKRFYIQSAFEMSNSELYYPNQEGKFLYVRHGESLYNVEMRKDIDLMGQQFQIYKDDAIKDKIDQLKSNKNITDKDIIREFKKRVKDFKGKRLSFTNLLKEAVEIVGYKNKLK